MKTFLPTLALAACALFVAACTVQPVAPQAPAAARAPMSVYTHKEAGKDANHYTLHTLFIGEGLSGPARYTAAAFQNGTRYSLATSGNGTYAIANNEITVKAGGLEGKGAFKAGEHLVIGDKKFDFSTRL